MAKCNYVSKKEVVERKKFINLKIIEVQKKTKKKYGKTFNYMLVGSAKRNLVVKKGNSVYDLDYQLLFLGETFENANPPKLKIFIKKKFEEILGDNYTVNMSTSVISIHKMDSCGKNAIQSFDIALLKNNSKTGNKEILRGKTSDSTNDDYIRWEELSKSREIYEKRKKIKGNYMWQTLREIFKCKKCENFNLDQDNKKSGFSLYLESIEETIQKNN